MSDFVAFFHSGNRVERKEDIGKTLPRNMYWGVYEIASNGQKLIEYSPPKRNNLIMSLFGWLADDRSRQSRRKVYATTEAVFVVAKPTLYLVLADRIFSPWCPKKLFWFWAGYTLPRNKAPLRRLVDVLFLKLASRYCDRILPLTEYEAAVLRNIYKIKNAVRAPFGIDVSFYCPQDIDRDIDVIVIGDNANRDWGIVIDAAKRLPDKSFVFVSRKQEFTNFILPENVSVRRKETYESSRLLLLQSKCMVLSTQSNDHFSGMTTVLMTMACGRVVISDENRHHQDFSLIPGENFIQYTRGNLESLISGLQSVFEDEKLRRKIELNARECAITNSTEACAASLRRILGV